MKTIGLLQRIESVHLKKGDRKMKKNELSADLINVTPTVVEDNVVEESQMPPKDETVIEPVKYMKNKAGKLEDLSATTKDDYAKDFATYLKEAAENGTKISQEDEDQFLKDIKDGKIISSTLQKYGVTNFSDFNKLSGQGKLKTPAAEVQKSRVADKKDELKTTNEAIKQVANKTNAENNTTMPAATAMPNVAMNNVVDYSSITPDSYKTSSANAKGMASYLKGKNAKLNEDVLKYVGISDNLDNRLANEYGYSVAELNKMKKNGIPEQKYERSRFISKGLSDSQKKEADNILDILDDPNASDEDKANATSRLLNIQASAQAMNSGADIISNAAGAAEQTKNSANALVDPQYLENLPKGLVQAYTSGKFGDPESDDAKSRLGYFILDNIATGLSNFRIGRSSPAFGDKQSKYDKYLDTELTNAMQRKNDSINNVNNAALDIVKKGGLSEVDFKNAIANWSKDETLNNYSTQLSATEKASAVLADKALGQFIANLPQEDRNSAAYGSMLLAKGDINEAVPMLMASGIDVDGYLKAIQETAKSDATMSKYVTIAINQKNALEQQNNATDNAIRQAQVNFDNDVKKLDITYQQEMNKLKQELLNGEELAKVQAEWTNWLDKKQSWRKVGQSFVTGGLDLLKKTFEGLGRGVGEAAGMAAMGF